MKAIHIRNFALAVMTLLPVACVQEKFEKGQPDLEGCMGVYFVEEQENAKLHTLELGKDKTSLDFKVRRVDDSSEAEVPYTLSVYYLDTEDLTDTSIVEVPVSARNLFDTDETVEFMQGQKESTIRVDFNKINTGVTYYCTLTISDPEYVPVYGNNASSLSFSVEMYEWVNMGTARYRDGIISEMFTGDGKYLETSVKIQKRADKERYFRMKNVYSASYLARLLEGEEAFKEDSLALKESYGSIIDANRYIYIDATDSSKVYFPAQKTGIDYPSLGEIYMASDVPEASGTNNMHYGKLDENGVITFPKKGLLFGIQGYFYVSNTAGKGRLVLPDENGHQTAAADFGIDLSAGEMKPEGVIPVTFSLEKDVASVKYCVFNGKISSTLLDLFVKDVQTASEAQSQRINAGGTYDISFKEGSETGIYTLIACSYDANNNYRSYNTVELGYYTSEDQEDCEIYIKFEASTNDRYESEKEEEDYNSENSFQYWVRGKNLTNASISYYPTSYYNTYKDRIHESMKNSFLTSAALKAINQQELSGVVGGLEASTCYTFVIYAENGYHRGFYTDTVQIKGVADYAEKSFYYDDIDKYHAANGTPNISAYTTDEWIPVSIDIYDAKATGRTIRGGWRAETVRFAEKDGKLVASGLFPALATNPDITFDFKDGIFYMTRNMLAKVTVKDTTHLVPSMQLEYKYLPKILGFSGSSYLEYYKNDVKNENYDMFAGGFVDKDIIAFTDNRTKYDFWAFGLGGYLKDNLGQQYLGDLIGEGHGNLILVRNNERGRSLIANLMEDDSQTGSSERNPEAIFESHTGIPAKPSIVINDLKPVDSPINIVEFSAVKTKEKAKLINLQELQPVTIMR